MTRSYFSFMFALLLAAFMAPGVLQAEETSEKQNSEKQTLEATVTISVDYLLTLPEDYDPNKSWPLVMFLHGAGERGQDLELVKKHGPPKLVEAGKKFPFILVCPQCPEDQWWDNFKLTVLLNELESKYSVDKDRIYLTGLSMGGFGTWSLVAYTPERFAAIAPVCGGGNPYHAKIFSHVPVWAFHGAKDTVIPLIRSEEMVAALKKEKAQPKLTVYPEAAHDSWTETYNNPALYEWLLKHKRVPRPKKEKK